MSGQYNLRNPAVKRLMKEAQELRESTEQYFAQPLEDNLFEWHFTIRGPVDSEFDGGIYHGRITLPPEYPMKPPSIMLLTPNGRFETFKKICLSISGHHPESWQPSWSIRTALLAIIGFMPTHGNGAIGSLDYTTDERKLLAKRSVDWKCTECGSMKTILKPVTEASKKTTQEARELASQINFQGEKSTVKSEGSPTGQTTVAGPSPLATVTTASTAQSPPTTIQTPAVPPPTMQAMFSQNFPGGVPNAFMAQRMMMPPGGPMGPFARMAWPTMPPGGMPPGARPPWAPGMMYPWPPMFNPMMMNAQMTAMMNHRMPAPPTSIGSISSTTATFTSTTGTAPTQAPVASTSPAASTNSTSSTPSQPPTTQVSSTTPASPSTSAPTEPASSSESNNTPTPVSTSETPSTPTTSASSISTPPSATGLRHRTTPATQSSSTAASYGLAELPTVQGGENPLVVLVMALLGLIIIALILRRLYNVVNAGAFDNNF